MKKKHVNTAKHGWTVKYKSRGKWIGPYVGTSTKYTAEHYIYPDKFNAVNDERYVRLMVKRPTKVVKV
jgi:hypothetical protein